MQPHPIEYRPHPDEPEFETESGEWLAWAQDPEVIDIYAIHAKGDTSQVWYIGQSNNTTTRAEAHRASANVNARLPLYRWLAEHEWDITPIETVRTRNAARVAERRWIKHYLQINPELFNIQENPNAVVDSTTSTPRARKSKALKALRTTVESRGGRVYTDLLVLVSATGEVTLAQWDKYTPKKIKPSELITGNE